MFAVQDIHEIKVGTWVEDRSYGSKMDVPMLESLLWDAACGIAGSMDARLKAVVQELEFESYLSCEEMGGIV